MPEGDGTPPSTPSSITTSKTDEVAGPEGDGDDSFSRQCAAAEAEAMSEDSYEMVPGAED